MPGTHTYDSNTLRDVHSPFIHSWSTSMWVQACESDILGDVHSVVFSYENENFDPGLLFQTYLWKHLPCFYLLMGVQILFEACDFKYFNMFAQLHLLVKMRTCSRHVVSDKLGETLALFSFTRGHCGVWSRPVLSCILEKVCAFLRVHGK